MIQSKLMTLEEAADYLRIRPKTLYNWHSEGKIRGTKLGGLKFDRCYIEELIKRHTDNGK